MPVFTSLNRRTSPAADQRPGQELPEAVRRALPMRFEAVGEALVSETSIVAACTVVGRDVARDGATLGEALDGLRATCLRVTNAFPDLVAAEALATAWAEATLDFLHQQSCEDPLTGLASLAHVRTRLAELYRHAEQAGTSVSVNEALVIIELTDLSYEEPPEHPFTRPLDLVRLCETTRTVFGGSETIGRLGVNSVVVLVRREPALHVSVRLLRELLDERGLGTGKARVWVEGLPATLGSAVGLLADLAH